MWQLDRVRHITKGVMRQKSQCVRNMVCFLLLLMPLTASAGPDRWLVLQTFYKIIPNSGVIDQKSMRECSYDNLSCRYCRNIVNNPYQDGAGNRVCHECSGSMRKFLAQQKTIAATSASSSTPTSTSNHTGLDNDSAYYGLLLQIFPRYGNVRDDLEDVMTDLQKELGTEDYKVNPDRAQNKVINKFQKDNLLFCCDCNITFKSTFFNVYSHAMEHMVVCVYCDASFGLKGSIDEGAVPDLDQRRRLLEEHQPKCSAACIYCNKEYLRADLPYHQAACPEKVVTCSGCKTGGTVLLGQYNEHIVSHYSLSPGENDHHTVTCPVCQQSVSGLDYPVHHERLHAVNPEELQACPHCEQSFYSGSDLFEHAQKEHTAEIVKILIDSNAGYPVDSDQQEGDASASAKGQMMVIIQAIKSSRPVKKVEDSSGAAAASVTAEEIQKLNEGLQRLTLEVMSHKSSNRMPDQNTENTQQGLIQQVKSLETQMADIADRLNLESHDKSSSREDTGVMTYQSLKKTVETLGNQIVSVQKRMGELDMNLQASLSTTHSGSLLWRIPEIARRKRDAIEERVTSIYSPPFYTGRNGYKMCVRAYLNGDGMGYKTHLSLFFVLMKGEFDSLLKWPFEYKVSLILVDQTHRKHIVQTFKPTVESNSFQKPVSDMNVASGCPQFAKLSALNDDDYVKDDVIFVKCIIDTTKIFHP